jgi:antitoxin ParD1/3/4
VREKIAQGMRSLREGKGTDGDAFFAQMEAELAALERQGHK